MSEFTITKDEDGMRLDKYLTSQLSDITRSQIKKMIKSGNVLLNKKKPTVHQFLKENDVITIQEQSQSKLTKIKSNLPAQAAAPELPKLNIVEDTKHFIVINKPSGLLVHEASGKNEPTLVDLVLEKYPNIAKIGEDPMRPGIVHRLDKEVSGLIVVAKTQDMFDHLKKQFKAREIKKEYLALVHGAPQNSEGQINFNIDRSETTDYKMAAVPEHEDRGRKATTEFELLENIGNYSLLKIKPKTGRTHQIRVHLNAFGLPVVGDLVYKPKKLKTKIKMHRIFLHASYLGFHDLENNWLEFSLPLPDDLQNILDNLKED